jgi:hypothetical protein
MVRSQQNHEINKTRDKQQQDRENHDQSRKVRRRPSIDDSEVSERGGLKRRRKVEKKSERTEGFVRLIFTRHVKMTRKLMMSVVN